MPATAATYRVGIDENGLGARLGPLMVTAVLAEVDPRGRALFERSLPKSLRAELGDSKRLVSHGDVALGEAWARALGGNAESPAELFEVVSLDRTEGLQGICPARTLSQCWSTAEERFQASDELVERVRRQVQKLERRGLRLCLVRTHALCTRRLNLDRDDGKNRFVADLHAMERLIIHFHEVMPRDALDVVCGKVGAITSYDRFFGPLAGWLHTTREESPARSTYRFAGLGDVSFVRDADASDPLVMVASLIGKYWRELFMHRIGRAYGYAEDGPSGYHDPVTDRFVVATAALRRQRRVSSRCFERERDVTIPAGEVRA